MTLPSMSFLTGLKAIEPSISANQPSISKLYIHEKREIMEDNVPNKVVNDSAASRNSVVDTALFFSLSTGTLTNERLSVSRKVFPGGITTAMIVGLGEKVRRRVGDRAVWRRCST